jgi:hypothetical protein
VRLVITAAKSAQHFQFDVLCALGLSAPLREKYDPRI